MLPDPAIDAKAVRDQSVANQSTVDVTGAYHPEGPTTLAGAASAPPVDAPRIAGYTITHELARGGMGRVLAGRELALDREVAIKTLLPGSDASRFITEAKITARLPHPSIPPVYALGTLSDGSPYLAMKLVRGQTLAEQLKARTNTLDDLPRFLQIFEQIAQAVGFAHSQGIIHRDLKPANVMVGAFGEVQVMDWGLAKDLGTTAKDVGATVSVLRNRAEVDAALPRSTEAVAPQSTENHETVPYETPNQKGDETRSGSVMGTPNYMAPEQARGEVVDTRADVFALGGILCAILTGKAVFGGTTVIETVKQAAAGDTAEAIKRLEACGAEADVIALARHCLATIASERPADGQAVAKLVAGYRQGVEQRLKQAETARAEALVREAEQRKRRKQLLVAGVTVLLTLLAGLGVSLWQMNRAIDAEGQAKFNEQQARDERDAKDVALKAEQTARKEAETNLGYAKEGNKILGSVFEGLDPKAKYVEISDLRNALRDNLEKAVKQLEGSSIGDPLVVAEMQNTLGLSLLGLGEAQLAITLFEKTRATRSAKLGPDHLDTIGSMNNLALGYYSAGKLDKALPLYEETFTLFKSKLGPDHPFTLTTMSNLAEGYRAIGKMDKLLTLLEETYKIKKNKLGLDHHDTIFSLNNLAGGYMDAGQLERSVMILEETLKLMKDKLGAVDPATLTCMNNLAMGYQAVGKHDLAMPLLEDALKFRKAKLGVDHPSTFTSMNNLALCYQEARKLDQAVTLFEETLKLAKSKFGPDHPSTLSIMGNLANGYQGVGKLDLALPLLEEALKSKKAKLGADHPSVLSSMNGLANGYFSIGNLNKALTFFEETVKLCKIKFGLDHPHTLVAMNNLAMCHKSTGNLNIALPLLEETLKFRQAKLGINHPDSIKSMGNLGSAYCAANQGEKASTILKQFVSTRRKQAQSNDPQFADLLSQVANELSKCKQFVTAEELLRECLTIREKTQPDAWTTFNTQSMLGGAFLGQKKYAEAEPLLLKGYEGMMAREKTIPAQGSTRLPEALDRLIQVYTETNKPDEVKKWQAEKDKLSKPVEKKN